jgi:hypothetical protein
VEPFLSEAFVMQVRSFGMFSILILFAIFRYTFIGNIFYLIVSIISMILGADLFLAGQGQQYLLQYFQHLLR